MSSLPHDDLASRLDAAITTDPRSWGRDPLLAELTLAYQRRDTDPATWAAIHDTLRRHRVLRAAIAAAKARASRIAADIDPGWPCRRVGDDPPRYEIDVPTDDGERTIELTAAQILSQTQYEVRYCETIGSLPPIMSRADHRRMVGALLARAERVERSHEEGRRGAIDDAVEAVLVDPHVGADEADARDRAVDIAGVRYVRIAVVRGWLRDAGTTLTAAEIGDSMRRLGWRPHGHRFGPQRSRVWCRAIDGGETCDA